MPQELQWLGKQAAGCEKIVELGSYKGRSTRAMLDNSKAHIWCVDDWNGRYANISQTRDHQYREFLYNVRDHIAAGRVTVLRMTTEVGVVQLRKEAPFDMIFIDADHTYEGVSFDIVAYRPLLRPGGLLCGHDHQHEPIRTAVQELVPDYEVITTIWYARI